MKRFLILLVVVAFSTITMFLATDKSAAVLGMRVACMGRSDPCWIAVGGTGAIVLGMGYGLVALTWIGAGLFFATGQLAAGLIAFGQLAIGGVFFAGQVGTGLAGLGQGGLGLLTVTQGGDNADGRRFLEQLGDELNELLRFFPGPKLVEPE